MEYLYNNLFENVIIFHVRFSINDSSTLMNG